MKKEYLIYKLSEDLKEATRIERMNCSGSLM